MNPPPPLLILVCLPLLLLHVVSACPKSCASFDISYPFGAAPSCGAPGFQLYCDSPPYPIWTLPLGNPFINYTVLEIANHHDNGSITLSLPASNSDLPCTPNPKTNDASNPPPANAYPFDGVNLSDFTPFANLSFSSQDVFFFFGCTVIAPNRNNMAVNSPACINFQKDHCPQTPLCAQFFPANMLLNWTFFWDDLRCAGYESFLTAQLEHNGDLNYMSTQLSWSNVAHNSQCIACEQSGGTCGYDVSDNSFRCFCSGETYDNNCPPQGCIGVLCSTGAKIAAFGVPSALVIASITVLIVCFVRRKRNGSVPDRLTNRSSNISSSGGSKPFDSSRYGAVSAKEFSFKELVQATDSFSENRMLGDGGFGAVYEGLLQGRKVAVKRLYHDNFRRMEKFFNEIRILTSLRHYNLVKLYGYCCEDERDLLLVFEYVSNGTLAEHLHKPNDTAQGLPWKVRLQIACETADALTYLHNSVNPPIFHRDVKSTNILLDEHFHVKLADFGLSRLVPPEASHISTAPQGTPGYLDPDYHQCYQLTDKSDVYSFGVVLIELISAMLAVDINRDRREINLSNLAITKIASGTWHEMVDPRLGIDIYPDVERMVARVVEIAFRCLAADKDDRPKMADVAEELAKIEESGHGLSNTETKIDVSCGAQTIKSRAVHSSNSVESPSPGSNTSSTLSSF